MCGEALKTNLFSGGAAHELYAENSAWDAAATASASAFVQQRQKLLPAALEALFHRFTALLRPEKTFRGYRLLAVDGSSLKSAAYPEDRASYRPFT